MSDQQNSIIHKRLQKLCELDATTKIPFIMVELRGNEDQDGFIEICGKDEYGVYRALDRWLTSTWSCKKLDAGDLSEDTMVPFCDALYEWKTFRTQGEEGLSNMGQATMQLVDFMANELGWTLGVVNGGNVGKCGQIREQQVIFKAPHPMNCVVPHVMIELRSAGFIEVCGSQTGALDQLEEHFQNQFGATRLEGYESFCDRYYYIPPGIFKERGNKGENNLGLLTTQVCDSVVRLMPGWSLVTLNGGNAGEAGDHREQELVFRWDNHPLQSAPHLLVELRDAGFIEVCGDDTDGIYDKLEKWLKKQWGCSKINGNDKLTSNEYYGAKFNWKPKDMMISTAEVTGFFHEQGWQMQVTSQGTVKVKGKSDSREQQIIVRPGASGLGVVEPHLVIELYIGEGDPEISKNPDLTQIRGNQYIRVQPIGDCSKAVQEFQKFVAEYMGGVSSKKAGKYDCDVFLSRGVTDTNLGQWTMRICDFMVDGLGWSFVVCNVCNLGDYGSNREQQLIFRYDGERRPMPKANLDVTTLCPSMWSGTRFPRYWKIPEVLNGKTAQQVMACDQEEIEGLQDMLDATFKRILTRDRRYEYQVSSNEEMPYRLEVVHAFRSENAPLWHRLQESKRLIPGGIEPFPVKTHGSGKVIGKRLDQHEAYLYHGTNPSSSMSILKSGFSLDQAGKSTGTMFGYGVYLAECSSKSDEYATDDGGGTYPGLRALLVCRCLVGNPKVVTDPGDHVQTAKQEGYNCVVGDRESKVGTYRETIFHDEAQIYPEFTVIYRRQYEQNRVKPPMRRKTSGTTGRCWQVKFDKGWANLSPDVNAHLLEAMKKNQNTVEVDISDVKYTFDLAAREQINKESGTKRALRPPMVKPF